MNPSTLPAPPLAEVYDVAVIGGGINGVGIAADAAGRGLSVFLCEKDDLASHRKGKDRGVNIREGA